MPTNGRPYLRIARPSVGGIEALASGLSPTCSSARPRWATAPGAGAVPAFATAAFAWSAAPSAPCCCPRPSSSALRAAASAPTETCSSTATRLTSSPHQPERSPHEVFVSSRAGRSRPPASPGVWILRKPGRWAAAPRPRPRRCTGWRPRCSAATAAVPAYSASHRTPRCSTTRRTWLAKTARRSRERHIRVVVYHGCQVVLASCYASTW